MVIGRGHLFIVVFRKVKYRLLALVKKLKTLTEKLKADLPESSYQELLLWLLRKRRRFKITGLSMFPLLKPGEQILVNPKAYLDSSPEIGDLVVAIHPYDSNLQIVKRVALVRPDGSCFLQGDNSPESTDSRSFGAIASQQIIGKVTSRLP